ncbi:MAG TPA: hypothetical protein VMZ28_18810 [Kofleriaceae bacterium]|nr:hypothetical protein [Kofleriaceae bacterium]
MIARALVVVLGVAGCSHEATEARVVPVESKDRPARAPTARLELKVVDSGDALSEKVYARAVEDIRKDNPGASDDSILDDCLTTAAGVGVSLDFWMHDPTGTRTTDWYLRGRDRAALEAYLAVFPPGPDHEWGYELREERCGRERQPQPMWRSYYLFREAELTGASVAATEPQWNEPLNRPEVVVTFDRDGARRFARLTHEIAGKKMAIVIDGKVVSAPVIEEAISGGRMWITLLDPTQLEMDARALADALAPR